MKKYLTMITNSITATWRISKSLIWKRKMPIILVALALIITPLSMWRISHYNEEGVKIVKPKAVEVIKNTDLIYLIHADGLHQAMIGGPEITLRPSEGVEVRFEINNIFRYEDDYYFWKSERFEKPENVVMLQCNNEERWSPASLDMSTPIFINKEHVKITCRLVLSWPAPAPTSFETVLVQAGKVVSISPIIAYLRVVPVNTLPSRDKNACQRCHVRGDDDIRKEIAGMKGLKNTVVEKTEGIFGEDFFKRKTL